MLKSPDVRITQILVAHRFPEDQHIIGPMYRPKVPQQQPSAPHRLPKQQGMPTVQDLTFALGEANKRQNQVVELPWGSASSIAYILSIACSGNNEPVWSLFEGETTEPLWRHPSRDLALVHSLLFQSVPDDLVSTGTSGSAIAGNSMAGSTMGSPASKPALTSGQFPVTSAPSDSKVSLQGRLENMQLPTLVQSIQMSKMNGRLHLFDKGNGAQVFFVDGLPVHSTTAESIGDQAIVEIMCWEEGDFSFYPEESSEERTVKRRLDSMIMEGITLLDQKKFLQGQGLTPESYLFKKDLTMTADEFKARLSKGAPLDLGAQKGFYDLIDNRSRLQDILQRRPMARIEWIPILFNLVSCGLAGVSETSPNAGRAVGLAAADIDRSQIQQVLRSLVRGETGMFTYPAFLFFLEQEFSKAVVLAMPLSVIIFEARLSYGEAPQPLPLPALREICARLEPLKRPFDIIAHYETFDFALLLPGASSRVARTVGNRVAEVLYAAPLCPGPSHRLLLAGGIASAPEDTQDPGKLIAAAREAKARAKETRVPVKMFAELEQKH
ncbi:MAG: DUF4388 domain-containing protein [Candidatus Obscuribacterales bacterium]|nr:DUF4388 domain-containing protein [Candidatus Obscuribacterales bacterium]